MKYAKYICKLCKRSLSEQDEFCPDCGREGNKISVNQEPNVGSL
jgi:RNA polymerase subunit RPABC4/transcription elongation factor Spt4